MQRYLIGGGLLLAWAALLAVSMAANIDLATSWANDTYDARILTGAAMASDTIKALAPVGFLLALQARNKAAVAACGFLFVVTQTFSATAAIGYASKARTGFYEAQEAGAEKREKLDAERARVNQQLQWLPAARDRSIVEADMAQHRASKLYRSTERCTRASGDAAEVFCRAYWQLEAEAATADTRAGYVSAIAEIDAKLDALGTAGGDTQLAAMVTLTGFNERELIAGLSIVVAVLIELGSALGLVAAAGVLTPRKRETAATAAPIASQAPSVAVPTAPAAGSLGAKLRPVARAAA